MSQRAGLLLPLLLVLLMLVAQDPPPTEVPTPTETATETATASSTSTETQTLTPSETFTLIPEPTVTETAAPSETATSTETLTLTASSTATASATATSTAELTDFAELTETLAFESLVEVSTPTNTALATLSQPPFSTWCHAFDFLMNDGEWFLPDPPNRGAYNGAWNATENYEGVYNNVAVHIRKDFDFSATLTSIRVEYDIQGTAVRNVYAYTAGESVIFIYGTGGNGPGQVASWTGNGTAVNYLAVQVAADAVPEGNVPMGSGRIRKITLTGIGTNPFTSSNCPIPPTFTPTVTPTLGFCPVRSSGTSVENTLGGTPCGATFTSTPVEACVKLSRVGEIIVVEGGISVIYNARLTSEPLAGETVIITPRLDPTTALSNLSISPVSRQLNNTNWNTGRNFTVTALQDALLEPAEVFFLFHRTDSNLTSSPYYQRTSAQCLDSSGTRWITVNIPLAVQSQSILVQS